MKKFISLLLCAVLLLTPMTAFAASSDDAPYIKMGDANLDGKVNAIDARLVLRMAANLESKDGVSLYSVDADGSGKINAIDARLILRKSAGLAEFTFGFDGEGISNSIKALKSNTFMFDVTIDGMEFKIIKDGGNIQFISPDMSEEMAAWGMENCGMLVYENKLYMTYFSTELNADVAMYMDESMYDKFGMSPEEVDALASDITSILPDTLSEPDKYTENGKVMYKYVIAESSGKSILTVDEYGILKKIETASASGIVYDTVTVNSISAEAHISMDSFGYVI